MEGVRKSGTSASVGRHRGKSSSPFEYKRETAGFVAGVHETVDGDEKQLFSAQGKYEKAYDLY